MLLNFCCPFQIKIRVVRNDVAKGYYVISTAKLMASSIRQDSLFSISQSLQIASKSLPSVSLYINCNPQMSKWREIEKGSRAG